MRGGRRVLAIGARGGLVKASTGYAYQRIQRDSAAIAVSLVRRGHPFASGRPIAGTAFSTRCCSRCWIGTRRDWSRCSPGSSSAISVDRVLRFLDEDTTVREELRLIASLPPAPFVRASAAVLVGDR